VHVKQSCYATREWIETDNIKCPDRKFVLNGTEHSCPSKSYHLSSPPWPSASDGFLVFAVITLSLTNVTLGYTGVNWLGDKWFCWKLTLIPSDHEQPFTTPGCMTALSSGFPGFLLEILTQATISLHGPWTWKNTVQMAIDVAEIAVLKCYKNILRELFRSCSGYSVLVFSPAKLILRVFQTPF